MKMRMKIQERFIEKRLEEIKPREKCEEWGETKKKKKEHKRARNKEPQNVKRQRNMKRRKGEGNERRDSGGY